MSTGQWLLLVIGAPWLALSALAAVGFSLECRRRERQSVIRMHPCSDERQARTLPHVDDAGRWER